MYSFRNTSQRVLQRQVWQTNLHNTKHFYKGKDCLNFIYKNYYKFRKYIDKGEDIEENINKSIEILGITKEEYVQMLLKNSNMILLKSNKRKKLKKRISQ